ncbi:MAG: galactose-1-phosphate uridylyltransferase [Ilumatobacteraceae bacterium]
MTGDAGTLARHDLRHPDGRDFHVYGTRSGDLGSQPPALDIGDIHVRHDALTDTWVVVSPSRNTRPGGEVTTRRDDTGCPLCPGGAELPFEYEAAVFDNRFPALSPLAPPAHQPGAARALGRCQVVVYTSEHAGSLATLAPGRIATVVALWRDQCAARWADGYGYVMAFENHGAEVGATLAHPHGQLYALSFVPPVIVAKVAAHVTHRRQVGRCLGCDLADGHDGAGGADARTIVANESFAVEVPFAARWPFEVHVRARRHGCRRLADLTDGEALDLARAVRDVTARYDGVFGRDLPYLPCVQEAPEGAADWHLHVELLPPHRDADRLKVRASVETALGVFLNDSRPEESAARLRAVAVPPVSWDGVTIPDVIPDGRRARRRDER